MERTLRVPDRYLILHIITAIGTDRLPSFFAAKISNRRRWVLEAWREADLLHHTFTQFGSFVILDNRALIQAELNLDLTVSLLC